MIIDFKEIPEANLGGGKQDTFELFGRDFLQELGFEIIRQPDRGPDGKKDIIVQEVRNGVGGTTTINWLVSCKHFAHSKKSSAVKDTDEPNILERLTSNNCQGFIGIYSTIASSSLSNMLYGNKEKFEYQIFDHERIEKQILDNNQRHLLFKRYFTNSYDKHKHLLRENKTSDNSSTLKGNSLNFSEEDILRICKNAIIIIEIAKIKDNYFNTDWDNKEKIINELYKYVEHSNIKVAREVFIFLNSVADQTRGGMTTDIAGSIFSLSLDFFPYYDKNQKKEIIELGSECINIAYNMIYDAAIYLNNYKITMYGLTILKYIYKKGKQEKIKALIEKVNGIYIEIEESLRRPDRDDLGSFLELVKIFRNDIEIGNLSFPVLPEHLYNSIYGSENE